MLTFHLVEKDLSYHYEDAAPPVDARSRRVSAGDSFEFSSTFMTRSNKRAGTLRAYCVFITEAQTTRRGEQRVTHIAIVGGTGMYEEATGSVTSVKQWRRSGADTFHVILR